MKSWKLKILGILIVSLSLLQFSFAMSMNDDGSGTSCMFSEHCIFASVLHKGETALPLLPLFLPIHFALVAVLISKLYTRPLALVTNSFSLRRTLKGIIQRE